MTLTRTLTRTLTLTTTTTPVQYYSFFTLLMLAASLAFLPVCCVYKEQSYLPRSAPSPGNSSPETEPDRGSRDSVPKLHL